MSINKSVVRAIHILNLLSKNRELTLSELSDFLQIPVSSTSDILKALIEEQMIEIANTRAKTYKIGIKNHLFGNAYLANLNIVEIASPILDELADQTKYVVFLAKLFEDSVLYLHKSSPLSDAEFISSCQVGMKTNLTTSALGKAMLAHNEWLLEKLLRSPLPKQTEFSITSPAKLRAELEEIRTKNYARDMFENDERIACVGFPIYNQGGRVDHAISISGWFKETRNMEREIELGKKCAQNISFRLGYIGQ